MVGTIWNCSLAGVHCNYRNALCILIRDHFFLENEDFLTLDVVNVVEFIIQLGSQKHCFFVDIVPDNETEGNEQFTIQLTSSHPFITFTNNEATVTIEGDTTYTFSGNPTPEIAYDTNFSGNTTPVTIEATCGGTQTAVTDREITMNVTIVEGSTSAGIIIIMLSLYRWPLSITIIIPCQSG